METIILKSIEKEPKKRYKSMHFFALDLRNFLEYKPILAKPTTFLDKVIKLVKRKPVVATLTILYSIYKY
ncbi:MAG: hypothetical protein ABDH23_06665 [Endomicrobiia bacterium]